MLAEQPRARPFRLRKASVNGLGLNDEWRHRSGDEIPTIGAVRLDQLRRDVTKGLASGPSEPWDPNAIKQKARARRAAAKGPAKA